MARDYNLVGKTIGELKNTIVGYMAGIVSVGAAIAKMDSYTGLQNRLKLVTASQTELNKAMQDTFSIAQATGQSWDSTAQVYQRFADNAKRLGISFQETALLTDTVAKAIAISGGSAASAEAALVQFGQALASGVLRGEEFNSISEQAPGLLKAIATGLNVNIGELRKMANEGQLSADVVVGALEKAKVSVDELFGKTDFTIGNSFTMLSNALTQFVGEAGKGSGAAQLISGSIQSLATNLDVVTNVAMVGTAFYVGSYIPALYSSFAAGYAKTKQLIEQTTVQYATINAERIAAAQALASAQAVVVNTQATLAALAAEKALEVERLKAQINQAGRIASATRMAQLRRVEAQVTAELTAAETALAAARARSAAASATSARVGAGLLGILGGPVGLGLTVAGVAASYLLMQDSADKVNKKLEEQAAVADRTASELNKLTGVDRKSAINDLTAAFAAQNNELGKSEKAVASALIDIQNYAKGNVEVTKISNEARLGTISYTEAVKQLNSLSISTDLYNALNDQVIKYDENYTKANKSAEALKVYGKETTLAGNAAQNAIVKHQNQADAINNVADAADKASEALSKYRDKQKDSVFESLYKTGLMDQGYNSAQSQAIYDLQMAKGNSAILSQADKDEALNTLKIQEQYKAREEAEKEAAKRVEDAAKKRGSERKRAADEAASLAKKQADLQKSLLYKFSTESQKMYIDYTQTVADINAAGFKSGDKSQYLSFAKARYDDEILLYKMQKDFELHEHKLNQEAKAHATYLIDQQIIDNRIDINRDEKIKYLASLDEKYNHQKRLLNLESNQRLNDASQAFQTDMQNMTAKYEFERQQIILNKSLSKPDREMLINASYRTQDLDNEKSRQQAWDGYRDAIGIDNSAQLAWGQRGKAIKSAYDWQLITQEEYQDAMLASESEYYRAKAALGLKDAADTTAGLANLMGSLLGEQSAGYKAMFAMSKAFALAKVIMNAPETFSNVYNSVSAIPVIGPYIAPVLASSALAVQLGQAASIKSMNLSGMAHSGIDNIPNEGTWLLDKGERVLSPRQNTDLTRYLNDQKQGNGNGTNVIINVPSGYTANESRDANGNVTIDVVEKMVKQSWSNLNQSNSFESKQVRNNIAAGRVR
ncbi:tape measure protein [bacterium SPL81]|nr:tape measure protein [Acinetobacter baumannii]